TMTLTAGTFDTASKAILIGGDWLNEGGTFRTNQSAITFYGGSGQTFNDVSTTTFAVLTSSNTSPRGVVFASSFTANQFIINGGTLGSETTVYFAADSTFTITTFKLTGSVGNAIFLRSTILGTNWYLDNAGSNSVSVVDVRDSDARGGLLINATG